MEYSVELRETLIGSGVDEEGGDEMDLTKDTFQLDYETELILAYGGGLLEDGESITPTLYHGTASEPDVIGE